MANTSQCQYLFTMQLAYRTPLICCSVGMCACSILCQRSCGVQRHWCTIMYIPKAEDAFKQSAYSSALQASDVSVLADIPGCPACQASPSAC